MPAYKRTNSATYIEEQSHSRLPGRRNSTQMLLDEAILTRHSTRLYLPKPVPRTLLERALELAAHSPSDTNTQAWRLFIVTGDALTRLKSSLTSAATDHAPQIPSLPAAFTKYRSALGQQVFGEGWGLAHDDLEGRRVAELRNFEFFGAPVAVIVCMSAELVGQAAFSVGMHLQTFLLALTELGLGSCVEVSVAGYPEVVRREVGIPDGLRVLVGVAVGYEDAEAGVNQVRIARDGVDENTVWVGE